MKETLHNAELNDILQKSIIFLLLYFYKDTFRRKPDFLFVA